MNDTRAFDAKPTGEQAEEAIPNLLTIISTIVSLHRKHGTPPTRIWFSPDLYTRVSRYLGQNTTALFGVPVTADCNANALPFVLECQGIQRSNQHED